MATYLNRFSKNQQFHYVVFNVSLENFFDLLESTSNRTLANYLFFHAAHEAAPYLNTDIRKTRQYAIEFMSPFNVVDAKYERRWDFCINDIFKYFSYQANAIYAQNFIPNGLKEKLNSISESVMDVIKDRFKTIEYLDDYTRINAMKKLNSTKRYLGIDDKWFDESHMEEISKKYNLNLENFLSNKLQAQKYFDQSQHLEVFNEINAYNLPFNNKIGKKNSFE